MMLNLHSEPYKYSVGGSLFPNWSPCFDATGRLAQGLLWFVVVTAIGCEKPLPKPQQEHVLLKSMFPIAFSPDGKRLLSRSRPDEGKVRVWDLRTGQELSEFSGPDITKHPSRNTLDGLTTERLSIGNFLLSPKGTLAASLEIDYQIRLREGCVLVLWDTVTGKVVRSVPVGLTGERAAFAFSPDGKLVALSDTLERVRLIDVESGKVFPSPQFPPNAANRPLTHLVFSPDGKHLACGQVASGGGTVSVWELASDFTSGKRVWECQMERDPISLAYSPDGRLVAASEWGGKTIHVWDAADSQRHFILGSPQAVSETKISFHPNGRYLASTGSTATHIWDLRTRKVIYTLDHAPRSGNDVAYSPDGKWLATACSPKSATPEHWEECFVIVWNLQPEKGTK
jgi:WD40 repeat protein